MKCGLCENVPAKLNPVPSLHNLSIVSVKFVKFLNLVAIFCFFNKKNYGEATLLLVNPRKCETCHGIRSNVFNVGRDRLI